MRTMPCAVFVAALIVTPSAFVGAADRSEDRPRDARLGRAGPANTAAEARSKAAELLTGFTPIRLPQLGRTIWPVQCSKLVRNAVEKRCSSVSLGRVFPIQVARATRRRDVHAGNWALRTIGTPRSAMPVDRPRPPGKPPLNAIRLAGELIGGAATGYAAARLGTKIVRGSRGYYPTMVSGYALGCAVGVYAVGSLGKETGSLWASLVGSLSGLAVSYFAGAVTDDPRVFTAVFYTAPLLGSIYVFNQSRRQDSPAR